MTIENDDTGEYNQGRRHSRNAPSQESLHRYILS